MYEAQPLILACWLQVPDAGCVVSQSLQPQDMGQTPTDRLSWSSCPSAFTKWLWASAHTVSIFAAWSWVHPTSPHSLLAIWSVVASLLTRAQLHAEAIRVYPHPPLQGEGLVSQGLP